MQDPISNLIRHEPDSFLATAPATVPKTSHMHTSPRSFVTLSLHESSPMKIRRPRNGTRRATTKASWVWIENVWSSPLHPLHPHIHTSISPQLELLPPLPPPPSFITPLLLLLLIYKESDHNSRNTLREIACCFSYVLFIICVSCHCVVTTWPGLWRKRGLFFCLFAVEVVEVRGESGICKGRGRKSLVWVTSYQCTYIENLPPSSLR